MNRLDLSKRSQILGLLVEGNSLRAAGRLADVSFNSVLKFVSDMGRACSDYQDMALRGLTCKRVQVDEIWSFCGCKQKNVPEEKRGEFGLGDVWTWTAIDADTKLAISWLVGDRDGGAARLFAKDIAARVSNRIQLTSDGHSPYLWAIEEAFGADIDFAQLVKVYGEPENSEKRYSPAVCLAAKPTPITGNPDPRHISTSFVERQNLTMRMSMRRFTRLTNAFSRKVENHAHAVAIHFMWYNFGRIHKTLRVTPAMAAGVTNHVWTLEEIAALDAQVANAKRGPYKKKAA